MHRCFQDLGNICICFNLCFQALDDYVQVYIHMFPISWKDAYTLMFQALGISAYTYVSKVLDIHVCMYTGEAWGVAPPGKKHTFAWGGRA